MIRHNHLTIKRSALGKDKKNLEEDKLATSKRNLAEHIIETRKKKEKSQKLKKY